MTLSLRVLCVSAPCACACVCVCVRVQGMARAKGVVEVLDGVRVRRGPNGGDDVTFQSPLRLVGPPTATATKAKALKARVTAPDRPSLRMMRRGTTTDTPSVTVAPDGSMMHENPLTVAAAQAARLPGAVPVGADPAPARSHLTGMSMYGARANFAAGHTRSLAGTAARMKTAVAEMKARPVGGAGLELEGATSVRDANAVLTAVTVLQRAGSARKSKTLFSPKAVGVSARAPDSSPV